MAILINLILQFNANEGSMVMYVRRLLVHIHHHTAFQYH